MPQLSKTRTLDASADAVWAVLADFPNISEWNSGVKASHATSDATGGVGAKRHCDLSPAGALEETVVGWEEGSKMVISIDQAKGLPIKTGEVTFDLSGSGETSQMAFRYDYEVGLVGKIIGPILKRQLDKGFDGFLDDLEAAAKAR